MSRRVKATLIIAAVAIAIITAGIAYIFAHPYQHVWIGPVDPYGPVPTSTNTGFQTGDNDNPTAIPRSSNATP